MNESNYSVVKCVFDVCCNGVGVEIAEHSEGFPQAHVKGGGPVS